MMKKLISMVFVLIMICCMTGTAMAESETENQITVTVKLNQTLTGEFRNMQGQLNYDPDVLTYVSHTMGTDYADYASKDMPAKKYFTFSRTDMSQTGFTTIPKGTIAVVTFEHDGSLTDVQLDTAFNLKLSVQDTKGNIEQMAAKTELVIEKSCAHSWKAATCTMPKTCSLCQATEGEKLDHVYSSSYTVDDKASTTADGSKSKHCTNKDCTAKTSVTAIPKISTMTLSASKYTYSGSAKKPTVTLKDSKGNTLKNGTDYTVSYKNNVNAGTATATITGKGNYQGTMSKTFTISKASMTGIKATGKTATYNGKSNTVTISGVPSGAKVYYKTSSSGKYTTTKPTRTSAGTTTVYYKVSKSNYNDVTGNVKIVVNKRSISKASLSATTYVYNGKAKQPTVTVKNSSGTKLKNGTHYTVSYKNNTKVGKATVTITGKGNYKGTITKTFTINPKATKITGLTKASKAFTVKWSKVTSQTSGYQIYYTTSTTRKNGKTYTVKSNKTTSKKFTGLKSKKKYYVWVRTYKTVDGKKYYSAWSARDYITTK